MFLKITLGLVLEIKIIELRPVIKKKNIIAGYYCLTHPHQVYIEMLSEHGIWAVSSIVEYCIDIAGVVGA